MRRIVLIISLVFVIDGFFINAFCAQESKISPKIVGGIETNATDWPWMVALVYSSDSSNYYGQFCGGSLIGSKWVVTAAHCLVDDFGNPSISTSGLQVLVGAHDLSTGEGERINVKRIIIHPQYESGTYNNDIALLELERSTSVETLPLYDGDSNLSGYDAVAIGWGNMSGVSGQTDYPNALRQVTLPVVTNTQCNSVYGGTITDSMMCAGFFSGGKDSCQGDSGGPLIINRNSRWELVGVTSWGEGCAEPGYYGVYSRVSALKSFIDYYINSSVNSSCQIAPKSLYINISSLPVAGVPVQFAVSSVSDCPDSIYYYYSYAPDYGTDNYDPVNGWVKMTGGDGFTTNKTISYAFNQPGYYVVVAGMSSERAIPAIMPQIGTTLAVRSSSGSSSGTCRVTPKLLSLDILKTPNAGSPVTFSVNGVSECSGSIYYYYSYAPNYGTSDYDPVNRWVRMINSTDGFTSNSMISYTFNDPGFYVVVVWTSPQRSSQNPTALIGTTLPVNP